MLPKLHPYLLTLFTALLSASAAFGDQPITDIHAPIPIRFTLKQPGFVTLVIENSDGQRVRNLVSETPFPAGANIIYWDALDDLERDTEAAKHAVYHIPGKLVAAGKYRVRGLVRPQIDLHYEMTAYHPGNPPWLTKDRSSGWLANHTPPSAILFVPEGAAPDRPGHPAPGGQILVGSFVSEGGSGLAWLNLDGKKIHGQEWVGGVWTGATQLCRDEGEHAIPGVYGFTGSAWRGDKYNGNHPELRLHMLVNAATKLKAPGDARMGTGEDPAILKPNFQLPADLPDPEHSGIPVLGGLAARDGILVAAVTPLDQLIFIDVAAHKVLATASIEKPRGLAFDHHGRLLAVSGAKLVVVQMPRLDRSTPTTQQAKLDEPAVLIATGLDDPQQLAIDKYDNVYVSNRGDSHCVRVFSSSGQPVRTIGTVGRPAVGLYHPEQMHNPNGITVDGYGRLWVAETDYLPKRLSVWTLDGRFVTAYYGPSHYGGGGSMDPTQPGHFFYADSGGGLELKLDGAHGTSVPLAVYQRPEFDPLKEFFRNDRSAAPETPMHVNGNTYLTDCYNTNPTGGIATASLSLLRDGVARPVAVIGQANDWPAFNPTVRFSARWTGQVKSTFSEEYTFHLTADEGARLWIGGKLIIDSWRHQNGESTGTAKLEAGKRHDFRLEYHNNGGGARVGLAWSSASQHKQTIPTIAFFPVDAQADAAAGAGLTAEYFSDHALTHLGDKRIDKTVNFTWGTAGLKNLTGPLAARLPAGANLGHDRILFVWSDLNDDGQVQPEEISCIAGDTMSVNFRGDLSAITGSGFLLKPIRSTPGGAPVYDVAHITTVVPDTQRPVSSGGGQAVLDKTGAFAFTNAPKPFSPYSIGGGKEGKATWSYPSLWPGLHSSHIAPLPDEPGELIGTTRLLGLPVTPLASDLGEVFAVNGNKGNVYLFTTDGLFIATLFRDSRTASWDPGSTARGTLVNDQTIHEEDFFPSISQTADGTIFLSVLNCCLVRVDGLEAARRLPVQEIMVAPEQLAAAQQFFIEREAARQAARKDDASKTLSVLLRPTPPTMSGKLADFQNAQWATIDERQTQVGDWGKRKLITAAAVTVSQGKLYAAFKTDTPTLLVNSGESLQNLFKTGGCLDLMIATDSDAPANRDKPVAGDERLLVTQVKGKTVAMLYRQVDPKAHGQGAEYTSPIKTVKFERVEDVSSAVQLVSGEDTDKAGKITLAVYEFSIPLDVLGLVPSAGKSIGADVGVLRGNGFQTLQRAYWSNKATGLVSDLPSEAELTPRLWGTWKF